MTPIRYRNVISVLKNPFSAGAYAYGKSEKRSAIVDDRVRKSYGHGRSLEHCEVLLKDHHEGYIEWAEFERNQAPLAANAFGILRLARTYGRVRVDAACARGLEIGPRPYGSVPSILQHGSRSATSRSRARQRTSIAPSEHPRFQLYH